MDRFFDDPEFYERYIAELDRISRPGLLEGFFDEIGEELEEKIRTIHRDDPEFIFSRDLYFRNRDLIRRLLHPRLPILARHDAGGPTPRLWVANTGLLASSRESPTVHRTASIPSATM